LVGSDIIAERSMKPRDVRSGVDCLKSRAKIKRPDAPLCTYRCKLFVAVVEDSVRPDRTLVAAMQQIADWLKKLGMSEYSQRFAENRIDISALRDLTD
jgi:hypothetical protein